MADSFEGPMARRGIAETVAAHSEDEYEEQQQQGIYSSRAANIQTTERRRDHPHGTGDLSNDESQSSDDGIEWESSGYNSSEYTSEDDDASDDGYEDQDTRQLLTNSSIGRMGGMGMGMRVGETGTGTTIGLDFEHNDRRYGGAGGGENDYEVLPLTNVDRESLECRQPEETNGRRERRPKRRGHGDRGRRSMHTALRVRGQGVMRTEQERLIAKKQLRTKMFWDVFYVFAWYGCSTSLSFYNKWLFSPAHYNFRFPLFTTSIHMVAQFVLSSLTLSLIPALRPKSAPSVKDFGTKIMPCAVASGLDVGLSNNSLKSITLAFYTMCKSSSLAFVLLFAFAFRLERPTWTLAGVIGVICLGLFMMVMSEVDFVLIGFIQVMLASVLGGLRWSLTQLLLERTDTKSGSLANPISTIFFLSPIMGICLCIVASLFEGYGNIFRSEFFQTVGSGFGTMGLLFLGGIFAFTMVLAEFNLIARTSVVSLSVLGIIKEVVTIVISSLVFHDRLTVVNILGLVITLSGIGFYHFMKLREAKIKIRRAAKEIADLHSATAANRMDGGVDRILVHDHRRKRRSGRSSQSHTSARQAAQEELEDGISAGRRAGTSDDLLGRELLFEADGSAKVRSSDDTLIHNLEHPSRSTPAVGGL